MMVTASRREFQDDNAKQSQLNWILSEQRAKKVLSFLNDIVRQALKLGTSNSNKGN